MNFTLKHGQTFSSVDLKNPFLIARFVFFAILAYLAILLIIFASWNIHVVTSTAFEVPLSSVFLLFNACIVSFCLLVGVVEVVAPAIRLSSVRFECLWSAAMGLLQTGVAIGATVSGPEGSCYFANAASCASSSLLVPIAWLNCFTLLSYFFTLAIVAVADNNAPSAVWKSSIYAIAINRTSPRAEGCEAKYWNSPDSAAECGYAFMGMKDTGKAPWAAAMKIRRGMDHPFPVSKKTSTPAPCPRAHEWVTGNGSRFVEIMNSPLKRPFQANVVARVSEVVDDHDLPIPLPSRLEWVRAGAIID